MSYRDDREVLRERVELLEQQLKVTSSKLAQAEQEAADLQKQLRLEQQHVERISHRLAKQRKTESPAWPKTDRPNHRIFGLVAGGILVVFFSLIWLYGTGP